MVVSTTFLAVSTTVVLVESTTLVVSVVLVPLVPLHATNEDASNRARVSLLMVFIVLNELIK